ncbi:efflux transporter outer membrane subunit [Brevundimonas naejangsanensis]|uniref:Efflux transporter outer membrane subunit n=2 Tax=Brevundimonas naejangsanensis TaxID=588932 RepID=A0A494RHR8_9CAUL|nr:efflux transporter outer membrane subunit [Brevundimonas naejangsanensis]
MARATRRRWGLDLILRRMAPALAVWLSACVAGPDSQEPRMQVPEAFSQAPSAVQSDAAWWRGFGDPLLDQLVAEARAANLDLRQAALRVEEARHQVRIVGAAAAPQVSANAQASDNRLSETTSIAPLLGGGGAPGSVPTGAPGTTFATYQVGFDASWELDLAGANRRAVQAAQARVDAAAWTARDAEIILTAEVARSYLDYRALNRRIDVNAQLKAVRAEALTYSQVRRRHGLTTILDERRAERDLAAVDAARQDLIAERAARAHALAGLLGRPPLALSAELAAAPVATGTPDAIPVGLPSDLLRRRPDLRAAERDLAAATADIGVAVADLYPSISLTGAVSLVSGSLAKLISGDSLQTSAGAGLTLPLLDGGRRRATVDLRRTQAQAALLAYQAAVLTALKDVEDALSRLEAERARKARLQAAEAAARDQLAAIQAQNTAGLATGLDLLAARASLLDASDALVQAQAATDQAVVALYKALGGGWDERRVAVSGGT